MSERVKLTKALADVLRATPDATDGAGGHHPPSSEERELERRGLIVTAYYGSHGGQFVCLYKRTDAGRAALSPLSEGNGERSQSHTVSTRPSDGVGDDAPRSGGEEAGWLVERKGWPTSMWWGGPGWTWSADAGDALRFAREADAKAFIDFHCLADVAMATEHVWIRA